MLTITGEARGVTTETVRPKEGQNFAPFEKTTIHLLVEVGQGREKIEDIGLGRDFPPSHLPVKGDEVTLQVGIDAFNTRGGGGYRLTAYSRVDAGSPALHVASSGD